MIEIDGSYGSGGGQIIRTSLALSALTEKPFHIINIRAKRQKPGLAAQHLSCVRAIAQLCNAKVKGATIGSKELYFEPGKIEEKKLKIDIGTAGSIPLVLQALMPALSKLEKTIEVEIVGGTAVKMAPSIDYIDNVLLKLLEKIGYLAKIKTIRHGFFPKGGGIVHFETERMRLKQYDFIEIGIPIKIEGISVASKFLENAKVAERQANEAKKVFNTSKELSKLQTNIKPQYVESYSPGSCITLWLETTNSVVGATSLGEKGKRAEIVGEEAAENLINEYKSGAVVDSHAADQLLPYLALVGGSLKTSSISEHAKTNAFVIEKFLPVKFKIDEKQNTIVVK